VRTAAAAVSELLAAETEPRQYLADAGVIPEGRPGDHCHLTVQGVAAVSRPGRAHAVRANPGDCFAEIALLRLSCGPRPSQPSSHREPPPWAGRNSSPP